MAHKTGIYFNDEEHEKIKLRANEYGQTFGKFVKNAALNNKIKIKKVPDPKLISQVQYVGNNLNQMTKRLHEMKLENMALDRVLLGSIHDVLSDLRNEISIIKSEVRK